jgi:hypothetical protein
MAAVDWPAVTAFTAGVPASSSELAILQLASSLAGGTAGTSLMEMTGGLDDTNGRHLLDALAHRFGWHERGTRHLVTGRQVDDPPLRAAGWTEPLPTFAELRGHAHRLLGDAADWLRCDYRPGTGPCGPATDAVRQAFAAIGTARNALDDAAAAQTRAHSRHRADPVPHRAEADSTQYPHSPNPESRHG